MMNGLQEIAGMIDKSEAGPEPEPDDLIMIAKMAGVSVAEVQEKIAKGWIPPKIKR